MNMWGSAPQPAGKNPTTTKPELGDEEKVARVPAIESDEESPAPLAIHPVD